METPKKPDPKIISGYDPARCLSQIEHNANVFIITFRTSKVLKRTYTTNHLTEHR